MSYTKKRVKIRAEASTWFNKYDMTDMTITICAWVEAEDGTKLSNVELKIKDLYGTFQKTVTTNSKGYCCLNVVLDKYTDVHTHLFEVEYSGSDEYFGAVGKAPISVGEKHRLRVTIGDLKKEYMPNEVITIHSKPPKLKRMWIPPVECEFNGIKTALWLNLDEYGRWSKGYFKIPDVHVNNLKSKLILKMDANDWYDSTRVEYVFDVIPVKKIRLVYSGYNFNMGVKFYNVNGTVKQNWNPPHLYRLYLHRDDDFDKLLAKSIRYHNVAIND